MPMWDATIAASTHNATEADDGTGFLTGDTEIKMYSNSAAASRWNGGFWWDNVTVPNGALIRVAWVSGVTGGSKGDDYDVTFYCEDVDDSAHFSTTADVTSRTTTTASSDVFDRTDAATTNAIPNRDGSTEYGPYISTPDITSCVQEVVDRGGWSSGNAICVIGKGNSGTNRVGGFGAYGTATTVSTKLYIVYTDDADEVRPVSTVGVEV